MMNNKTILVYFILGAIIGGFLSISIFSLLQDGDSETDQLLHQLNTLQDEKKYLLSMVENKSAEINHLADRVEELRSLIVSMSNEITRLRSEINISDIKIENSQIKIRGLRYGLHDNFDDLIEMGANYAQISIFTKIRKNGSISGFESSDDEIIGMITEAHERDLNVYLEIYPQREEGHHFKGQGLEDIDGFLDNMVEITVKWATLAEEYSVELFSPPNELFQYVGCDRAMIWYADILPKIRSVYSGEVVPRGLKFYTWDVYNSQPLETPLTAFNFSGWDYIASDFYGSRTQNVEEFRICLRENIRKSIELKDRYGVKGIIYGEVSHLGFTNMTYEESIYDYPCTKVFLEENIGKVDGFFFWGWKRYNPEKELLLKNFYLYEQPYQNLTIQQIKTSKWVETTAKIPTNDTLIYYQDNYTDLQKIGIQREPVRLNNETLELFNGGVFSPINIEKKWGDIHINGKIRIESGLVKIGVRINETYVFEFCITPSSQISMSIILRHDKDSDWIGNPVRQIDYLVEVGVWHEFDIWVVDRWFAIYIDGVYASNFYEPNAPLIGELCFASQLPMFGSNEAHMFLDDMVIYEILNEI